MRTNTKLSRPTPRTHEGAVAKRVSQELELRRSILSCMLFEGEYYESGVSIANRIDTLASQVSPDKVAELAIEARTAGNLRHAPLRLLLALIKNGYPKASEVIEHTLQRPDECPELISQYMAGDKNRPLDHQLKRGIAKAFTHYDQYQISKYQCREREWTLRDCMFMCHANPTKNLTKDKNLMPKVYEQLASNTLPAPETWEKRLSSKEETPKEVFTDMLGKTIRKERGSLGAMAVLRNLRNMQKAEVDDDLIRQALLAMNPERVLPFRFITAAKYAPMFESELETAMLKNLESEQKLSGKTILLVDISGSMDGPISDKSELARVDAACALAMLMREICEKVDVYSFSNTTKLVPPRHGFALRDAINKSQSHGGTDLGGAVQLANSKGYDRLVVMTDEQSSTRVPSPVGKGYMINVASYKNGVSYGKGWELHQDGFSAATVQYIADYEHQILGLN